MRARLSQRLLERINSFRRMTENDMAKARGTDEFGSIDPVPRRGSPFLHQRDTSPLTAPISLASGFAWG